MYPCRHIAPVAETGFSHGFTAYKIVGHFFALSYRKISGSNRVNNVFIRISNMSVPCPHAQLRCRTVIKKLWTFFGPWGRDRCQSPPCWIFLVKQIHPSTASEMTTRQVAILPCKAKRQYLLTSQVSRYCLLALQDSIGEPTIERWTAI